MKTDHFEIMALDKKDEELQPISVERTPTGYKAIVSRKEIERVLASDPSQRIRVEGVPVRISRDLLEGI